MALIAVSGQVGNVLQETEIYGAQTSTLGATSFKQRKVINVRIGNKPVKMKLNRTIDLGPGDHATAVGVDKRGELHALALRNDDTGLVYAFSPVLLLLLGVILSLFGLATLAILIGFIVLPLGLYLVFKGWQTFKAVGILRSVRPDTPLEAT